MSAAGRARVVELVAGATLSPEQPPLVHVGSGSQAPLEQQAGQTRLYELVTDRVEPSRRTGLTICTTKLHDEGWRVLVRYEVAGAYSRGDIDAMIAADMRAITRALEAASDWSDVLEHLTVGQYTFDYVPGPEGEPLALIAELPLRARFYE